MAKTIKIGIEPDILKWARISIGLSIDGVVEHFKKSSKKKFKVDKEYLLLIESGKQQLSFNLVKELSIFYKRPLSAFFLKTPPHEEPLPRDFRTIFSDVNEQLTKNTMLMIRRVRRVQMVTKELYDDLGIEYKFEFKKFSIQDSPNLVAKAVREKLDFNFEEQKKIKTPNDFFNLLRQKIESTGVLVLKGSFPLEDARAFSFVDKKPYVIVINNKDGNETGYTPKIFSLMHEFCHILLRESSICNDFVSSHKRVEKFCNQFAGEFLVPAENIIEFMPFKIKDEINIDNIDRYVEALRKVFKVSSLVILRRMLFLNYIDSAFYKKVSQGWKEDYEEAMKGRNKYIPRVSQERKAFNNYGRLFTKLVLEAQSANKITYSTAAEYLGIKVKYMPDLYNLALQKL